MDVESIEIKFPSNKFNLGFTLQDTPGVDSNVSAHQSTTEQFLYTSNMIVYTVDYNHVQSALNFQFMKRMNQVGIPIILLSIKLISIMRMKFLLIHLNKSRTIYTRLGY